MVSHVVRGAQVRVFENKVLRKIFGAKRDEFTGEWSMLHNSELHALYSSPNIAINLKSRRIWKDNFGFERDGLCSRNWIVLTKIGINGGLM